MYIQASVEDAEVDGGPIDVSWVMENRDIGLGLCGAN